MPTKNKKDNPIIAIKRIARAMGTKVEFGSQTTAPDNHWCQIKKILEPSHAFAIGWGASDEEAATSCLQNIATQLYIKSDKEPPIYYRIIPGQNGYYVVSAKSRLSKTFVRT